MANASLSDSLYFDNLFFVESEPYVAIGDNGTKLYVGGAASLVGGSFLGSIKQFSLSPAWDVSTASYVSEYVVHNEMLRTRGITFKGDGTRAYLVDDQGADLNEYSLSTAWNITTASYVRNFGISYQNTSNNGVVFKPDGTRFYLTGDGPAEVNEYSLSTAWNVNTASHVRVLAISGMSYPNGLAFKDDGTKMYVLSKFGSGVSEYSLSTAWDISTATFQRAYTDSIIDESRSWGLSFKPDGTRIYLSYTDPDGFVRLSDYSLAST